MTRTLGPIYSPMELRRTVKELLTPGRIGVVCDEITRQRDGGRATRVERVKSVVCREEFRLPEHGLPCVQIRCPSFRRSGRDGEGVYSATATLAIVVYHASADQDGEIGQSIVSIIGSACATLILQHLATFEPRVYGIDWIGVDPVENASGSRALHAVNHGFEVGVHEVLCDLAGPLPDDLPPDPGDLPEIESVSATTTPVEEIDP